MRLENLTVAEVQVRVAVAAKSRIRCGDQLGRGAGPIRRSSPRSTDDVSTP